MPCIKPTIPYVFSKVSSSVLFLKGSRNCGFEILNIYSPSSQRESRDKIHFSSPDHSGFLGVNTAILIHQAASEASERMMDVKLLQGCHLIYFLPFVTNAGTDTLVSLLNIHIKTTLVTVI